MNLIIDIGNTATKCAIFDGEELLEKHSFNNFSLDILKTLFSKDIHITRSILSSVVNHSLEIETFLDAKTHFVLFSHTTKIPIINKYQTPETLGKDRLAAAIGANNLFPNQDVLCIDVGTCIKFDFVDASNSYLGGGISPGITMRYKALKQFTGKLPLVTTSTKGVNLIGADTITSIQSGVQRGVSAEVKGIIEEYLAIYPNCKCVLTGGGAPQLQIDLKMNIFAAPNLVLQGLNKTLLIN